MYVTNCMGCYAKDVKKREILFPPSLQGKVACSPYHHGKSIPDTAQLTGEQHVVIGGSVSDGCCCNVSVSCNILLELMTVVTQNQTKYASKGENFLSSSARQLSQITRFFHAFFLSHHFPPLGILR